MANQNKQNGLRIEADIAEFSKACGIDYAIYADEATYQSPEWANGDATQQLQALRARLKEGVMAP